MNSAHWDYPLNSPDPAVVKKGMAGMETSLRNAHLWGADAVLLVPAVAGPKFSYYQDAWTRSQQQIRKLLPLAAELKVVIAVEEVWNKFLLSPLEFARYIDEFNIAFDPADANHLYTLSNGKVIAFFESFDGGNTFSATRWGFTKPFAMAVDPNSSRHIVASEVGGPTHVTFDGGVTWGDAAGLPGA